MERKDAFSAAHPAVGFVYFGFVLLFSMFFMHPVCLAVSLVSAILYSIYLRGRSAGGFLLFALLACMLPAALFNPLFNHAGATVLAYLPSGNPLTLESILYGVAAACMLAAVVIWFSCYNAVMTTDKFVYLFGRILPALSLVLSMALRFVPRFYAQLRAVRAAQRQGKLQSGFHPLRRARRGLAVLSAVITWSFENAIDTADSMKSRGYGLPARSAFSVYRFDGRDRNLLYWLLFCGMYILCGQGAGALDFRYYPTLRGAEISPLSLSFMLVYLALCLTPLALDVTADRQWARRERRGTE